jgi:hypothetical protein
LSARYPGAHADVPALRAAERAGRSPSQIAGLVNDDRLGAVWR